MKRRKLKTPPPPKPAPPGSKAAELQALKAGAYDMVTLIEQAQARLRAINQRISEVAQELERTKEIKPPPEDKKPAE